MTASGITIGVAAYNEQAIIVETVQEILRSLEGVKREIEILLLDDASTDGTSAYCQQAERMSPTVKYIRNEANLGFGGVYFRGAQLATKAWYMVLPGDNGVDSSSIRRMLDVVGQADVVVSYTMNPEFRRVGRRLLSALFIWLLNRISGRRLRYYNGPIICRTHHVRALDRISSSFAFHAEVLCQLLERGASVVEVGVMRQEYPGRRSNAFRLHNIVGVGKTLLKLIVNKVARTPSAAVVPVSPSIAPHS